jgi:hypothetical protein
MKFQAHFLRYRFLYVIFLYVHIKLHVHIKYKSEKYKNWKNYIFLSIHKITTFILDL